MIYEASIRLSHIPRDWKQAKIIMLLKKDKPANEIKSYRPISLLNCMAKLLEKIINHKLINFVENNNLLPPCQSSFRKAKSTQDQILRINQSIIDRFNHNYKTGAVFFDLEKAFDKTPHEGILHKMRTIGIPDTLIRWTSNFLTDRSFNVVNNNASSNKSISCVVPQGSCLSSTLFIIYFTDIAKEIPSDINVALFADDLCIWATNKSIKIIQRRFYFSKLFFK
jgi:hypothetical protein